MCKTFDWCLCTLPCPCNSPKARLAGDHDLTKSWIVWHCYGLGQNLRYGYVCHGVSLVSWEDFLKRNISWLRLLLVITESSGLHITVPPPLSPVVVLGSSFRMGRNMESENKSPDVPRKCDAFFPQFSFSITCLFQQLSLQIPPDSLLHPHLSSFGILLWRKALLRGCHGSFPHRWAAKPSKPKWWTSPVSSARQRYSFVHVPYKGDIPPVSFKAYLCIYNMFI